MMEKIDSLIKQYLKGRQTPVSGGRSSGYPDAAALNAYLTDALQGAELERFLGELRNDADLQEVVLRARALMESEGWEGEMVPAGLVGRAQGLMKESRPSGACPHCGKPITPFKRPPRTQKWKAAGWFLLAAVAFALSFEFSSRFMQFLVIALLAGIKGIVDLRTMKTQILIYKALSDGEAPQEGRLHRHSSRL